eukprot:TRINITY_DN4995_c0_g1_i7.p1 TRINITY_DN4995_c0_g1~~TRINITY_DN4995_c0_g1_i7.p1  ORF type:complete len:487 (+),score=73.00 TRINITY_DN4995_c0_g1_i7:332-1792(+)
MVYDIDLFVDRSALEFECGICLDLVSEPILVIPCEHLYCRVCIRDTALCPKDNGKIIEKKPLSGQLLRIYNALHMKCVNSSKGCDWIGALSDAQTHIDRHCNPSKNKKPIPHIDLFKSDIVLFENNDDSTWEELFYNLPTISTSSTSSSSSSRRLDSPPKSYGSFYSSSTTTTTTTTSSIEAFFAYANGNFPLGVCGLRNLGGTCFINSVLQCLSHTHALTHYLVHVHRDLFFSNSQPKREVVHKFKKLLVMLWSENTQQPTPNIAPSEFHSSLEIHAPEFRSRGEYRAQDSMPFLEWMLETLNQELKIAQILSPKSPSSKKTDRMKMLDYDLANETWSQFKVSNSSIITDLFCGLLKVTTVCTSCSKPSVNFEPFFYLSIPFPTSNLTFHITLVNYTESGIKEKQYTIEINNKSTVEDLKSSLSKVSGQNSGDITLTRISNNRIFQIPLLAHPLWKFSSRDEFVAYPSGDNEDTIYVQLLFRKLT